MLIENVDHTAHTKRTFSEGPFVFGSNIVRELKPLDLITKVSMWSIFPHMPN